MSDAKTWLNGYVHGAEHLAGAVEAYVADGAELGKALLMARIACLSFVNDVAKLPKGRR